MKLPNNNIQEQPEVHLYAFRRVIGGIVYEGKVPAASFEDAEKLAERIGGELDGRIQEK